MRARSIAIPPSDQLVSKLFGDYTHVKEEMEQGGWIGKLVNFLKFPIDLIDDIIVALKDFIAVSEKVLHQLVGGAFGILSIFLVGVVLKELYNDIVIHNSFNIFKKVRETYATLLQDKAIDEAGIQELLNALVEVEGNEHTFEGLLIQEEDRLYRIYKNLASLPILTTDFALSLAMIIGGAAGIHLYPLLIMGGITLYSMIELLDTVSEYNRAKKRGASEEVLHELKTQLAYKAVDLLASITITTGIALATFSLFAGVNVLTMGLPLAIIVGAATVAIAFKLFEHREAIYQSLTSFLKALGRKLSNGAKPDDTLNNSLTIDSADKKPGEEEEVKERLLDDSFNSETNDFEFKERNNSHKERTFLELQAENEQLRHEIQGLKEQTQPNSAVEPDDDNLILTQDSSNNLEDKPKLPRSNSAFSFFAQKAELFHADKVVASSDNYRSKLHRSTSFARS